MVSSPVSKENFSDLAERLPERQVLFCAISLRVNVPSLSIEKLKLVEKELKTLKEKGIKIVIITDYPFEFEGAIIYHSSRRKEQIRLIVDSKHVLTGELNSTCLYSSNNNLVELFKESLTNEIKLIDIEKGRR